MWKPGTTCATATVAPEQESSKKTVEERKKGPTAPKPTLSQNVLSMKFMQRKNHEEMLFAKQERQQEEWSNDIDISEEKDNRLICIPDVPDASLDQRLGRRSFGGFNAAIEAEQKASRSQRLHADANARALKDEVSAEEMAERMMKYTGLRKSVSKSSHHKNGRPPKRQKRDKYC